MERGFFYRMSWKGGLLLLPFFLYYVCYNQYLVIQRQFKNDSSVIYRSIDKSKKKTNKKKIIFGDSVGAQLYPNDQDSKLDFYSLTTSSPSSLVGVYVLLVNYMKNNEVRDVDFYYVAHSSSLRECLKGEYTYNHFVKPFYTFSNQSLFTQGVHDSVRAIPYWYAAQLPFIKISDWQPQYNFMKQEDYVQPFSPMYVEYFKKIDSLSKLHHFRFHAVMPLLREDNRYRNHEAIRQVISENHLEEIFSGYFENQKFLPNNQFHPQSNHYLHPYELGGNPLNL